ncbi:MAG: hypothetical protein A2W11_05395 [Ignavibacteria bacterium RBG_16_35_7]|nr:MAG: hypothetical protein A2W11_05395 [Ignavibacteria bacterium RBG_16_35_7]
MINKKRGIKMQIILNSVFIFASTIFISAQSLYLNKNNGSIERFFPGQGDNILFSKKITDGLPCPGLPTVTYEGKTYNTVQIGDQCWLKENLDVGEMIIGNPVNNGIIEKWCYDDDPNNCDTYGGLYYWWEAVQYDTTSGTRGCCPEGWHIPTLAEFETLKNYLNNDGNALKAEGQGTGDGAGTNTTGFSALLGGINYNFTYYDYLGLGEEGNFWSSSSFIGSQNGWNYVYYMILGSTSKDIIFDFYYDYFGMSVRCIKNGKKITSPKAGDKWMSGEIDTIKWEGGEVDSLVDIEYSTDGGSTWPGFIGNFIPADTGKWSWKIPEDLIGRKSLLRIKYHTSDEIFAVSDTFKIKPYIITRVDQNGEYVKYDINVYRWGFGNIQNDMWPENWYKQFDYTGIDPITNQQYSLWQGDSVFSKAKSEDFVDWMSIVNAYGENACYFYKSWGIYMPSALLKWKEFRKNWIGSCFGIAGTNELAFERRDEFLNKYPAFPKFQNPVDVKSDTSVIKTITEIHAHVYGDPTRRLHIENWLSKTPNQTLNELKDILKEDNTITRSLTFWENNGSGGHTVTPYKVNKVSKNIWGISIYDNEYSNDLTASIQINMTENSGNGNWNYSNFPNWGGPEKLILEPPAATYLDKPIFLKNAAHKSPFLIDEDEINFYPTYDTDVEIIDKLGNVTEYKSGKIENKIPGAVPLILPTGNESPPYCYYLPKNDYAIIINNSSSSSVSEYLDNGNKSYLFERGGVTQTQSDNLYFNEGFSVSNHDPELKNIKLLNLIIDTTASAEKLFILRSLDMAQNDSVKIVNQENTNLDLISHGSQKNYQIELEFASEVTLSRFVNDNINLSANTTHKIVPNWGDFADLTLTIYVDEGNNGSIDNTLIVQNQVTNINQDQGSLFPTEYKLEQNYPNPFNPTTTIGFGIMEKGNVRMSVLNILGEEIKVLLNEEKEAGHHSIDFNGSDLPSGVYFYQLRAGNFIDTKKMLLLK